jgi:hypothetical protein
MTDLSKLVRAPIEVDFGSIKLFMAPLSDFDMAQLDEYVRGEFIKNARNSLPKDADEETWQRMMRFAMNEAANLSWGRPPGSNIIVTPAGLARLAWQSSHHHTPGVTVEQIANALFDPKNVYMLKQRFSDINRLSKVSAQGGAEPGSRPTRRKKSTRSSRKSTGTRSSKSRT